MLRVRFEANIDDPRPIKWPIKHPYWITGEAGDGSYATVVAYADSEEQIFELWPEAKNLEVQEREVYTFTDRFPKPEWLNE